MNDSVTGSSIEWEHVPCPLCGETEGHVCLRAPDLLYRVSGEFTLQRCAGCSHVFLNPRPTRACIGQFYPADYGPFHQQGAGGKEPGGETRGQKSLAGGFRSWRWLRRMVLWWIESRAAPVPEIELTHLKSERAERGNVEAPARPRALELGCAHGAFLRQLREQGWECVGIEPATDVAQRAAESGLDVRVGSLESVMAADSQTFAPGRFEAVFAWMVVEHLHDPVATLRLVRGLLKPGGRLLFSVPNFGCWERRVFGPCWYALQLPTHLQHFTAASLRRLLAASGFELVELIPQRNVNNLVGSVGLWLRTRFPRWSLGDRLIRWTDNPTALGLCLLAPFARLLAAIHQAGRLTIVARRTDQ